MMVRLLGVVRRRLGGNQMVIRELRRSDGLA